MVNRRPVLLPKDIDGGRLQDAFLGMTPEALGALPGVNPAVDLGELAEAFRDGRAELMSLTPTDAAIILNGETVPAADGAAWVVTADDLRAWAETVPPTEGFSPERWLEKTGNALSEAIQPGRLAEAGRRFVAGEHGGAIFGERGIFSDKSEAEE